jgi:hypothetical protein
MEYNSHAEVLKTIGAGLARSFFLTHYHPIGIRITLVFLDRSRFAGGCWQNRFKNFLGSRRRNFWSVA